MTAGFGAEKGKDYPAVLSGKVDLPVINAGVEGDTTGTALLRIESDVLSHDPRIVIITLGGNDFLRGIPKEETLKNAEAIIDRIQKNGSLVVWAAVKTGLLSDHYLEDFKKLASRKQIILIPNILQGILFDPRYKYDQIHPNAQGYSLMAERIHDRIKPFVKNKTK